MTHDPTLPWCEKSFNDFAMANNRMIFDHAVTVEDDLLGMNFVTEAREIENLDIGLPENRDRVRKFLAAVHLMSKEVAVPDDGGFLTLRQPFLVHAIVRPTDAGLIKMTLDERWESEGFGRCMVLRRPLLLVTKHTLRIEPKGAYALGRWVAPIDAIHMAQRSGKAGMP